MSVGRYPAYKDSGVEWLGNVPSHWRHSCLRWLSSIYSGGTPDRQNSAFWQDGTIPWLNSGAVNQGVIVEPSAFITEEALQRCSARWVPAGSLIVALAGQGKTKGMVAQLAIRATCNQSMAAILPNQTILPRYLFWWLSANYQNIRNLSGGDDRDGLNQQLLGSIVCPLPPKDEQIAIAAFLDRETVKIDALVEEQRRLIVLLKEKLQAVISRTVTKGLNSEAPVKDNGIGSMGQVPANWSIVPIKSIASLAGRIGFRGYTTADLVEKGEGAIALSPSNLVNGTLSLEQCSYVSWEKFNESPEIIVEGLDVVLVKTGSSYGKSAIVPASSKMPMTINPQLLLLKRPRCNPLFLYFSIRASHIIDDIRVANTGGTIPTITQEFVGRIRIPLPPLHEQLAIAEYLQTMSASTERLIQQTNAAISLLHERRLALISAAVTGKIDVCGLCRSTEETANAA